MKELRIGVTVIGLQLQVSERATDGRKFETFTVGMACIVNDVAQTGYSRGDLLMLPINVEQTHFGLKCTIEQGQFCAYFIVPVIFRGVSRQVGRDRSNVVASCLVAS